MSEKSIDTHEAAKARIPDQPARSVAHATMHLDRRYPVSPARLWAALTEPAAKARWFGAASDAVEVMERTMDVRPGGRERLRCRWNGRVVSTFDATYHDVVEHERLVYCYEMYLDDRKISVSLASMELKADGDGTCLAVTEQGAFLDGYDDAGSRERGTRELLDALGTALIPGA